MKNTFKLSREQFQRLCLDCRRGNAESECLLTPFLTELDSQPLYEQFRCLLTTNDQDLLIWLIQPDLAPTAFQPLLKRIKKHYLMTLTKDEPSFKVPS